MGSSQTNPSSASSGRPDGWRPIESAPKDGTLVRLTWMDEGEPADMAVMAWGHIQRNGLFPDVCGMWVSPCGQVTWNADDGAGPTHWKPLSDGALGRQGNTSGKSTV